LAAAAKVAAGGALSSSRVFAVPPQNYVPFTLHQNGFASSQYAVGLTVGDALSGIGLRLGAEDLVSPPPDSLLTPGLHIYVQHASTVRLILEGKEQVVTTRAGSVGELLREVGFRTEPTDRVFPPPNEPITPGMSINVTTFRVVREFQDTPIDFDTVYVFESTLPVGESVLLEEGSQGYLRREFHVVTVNSREIQRELVSERVLLPRDQIVAVGAYEAAPPPAPPPPVVVASADGELDCARTLTVWATWYTGASAGGNGVTATGTPVQRGIVAVDPNVIPLGTRMYIPGYGFGLAADTGGGVIGNHIDLGFGANDVVDWRTGYVDICILN
jgi:3D (Asp-Asp-Asp) domain-containing protein